VTDGPFAETKDLIAIQQAARADRELGEDLVQVVLHGPGTDEQPAAGLRLDRPSRVSRAITAS
jgi:hypothetical protein